MENKTDKPYSLQDAKDEMCKRIKLPALNCIMNVENLLPITDGIAELYKEKATEELRNDFDEAVESNENLRKEMEGLIEIHHLQSEEFLSELTQVTGEKEELRKENEELVDISVKQNNTLKEWKIEIERLKESNKELVEDLKDAYNAFMNGELGLDSIVTNIEAAIQKSEGDVNKKI